jgi:hypothetical protein
MTTKEKVLSLARKFGAEISDSFDEETVYLDLPEGHAWCAECGHSHSLHINLQQPDAWADALERVEMGIQTCVNEECDYCHPYVNG